MTLLEHAPSTEAPRTASAAGRAQATAALAALAVVLGLILASVYFSLPSNVVSLRGEQPVRSFFTRLMPQGWGFFTKPPDSPELSPYLLADGELRYASRFPNSAADNLFGASREQRSQGPEMANLSRAAGDWLDCDEVQDDCRVAAVEALTATPVRNTAPVPTLCGSVVLVETVPVPWAFRGDYDGWRMDDRATMLEVECPSS